MQTHNITLISTVHKERGLCNSCELYKIIEAINPEVIFLEAFENSYSKYHQMICSQFGIYQERLEIKAIQLYQQSNTVEYVPVLDIELSDEFQKKISIVSENQDYKKIIDNYTLLQIDSGFKFLNSKLQITFQEEMRELENFIIDNKNLVHKAKQSIDAYEHSMLRNIYSFCKENSFNKAIFMCGAGHRKTIQQKIKEYEKNGNIKLNWTLYNDLN